MIILKYCFLLLHKNIYCVYSLSASNEYPQHMYLWRTRENYPIIITISNIVYYNKYNILLLNNSLDKHVISPRENVVGTH